MDHVYQESEEERNDGSLPYVCWEKMAEEVVVQQDFYVEKQMER